MGCHKAKPEANELTDAVIIDMLYMNIWLLQTVAGAYKRPVLYQHGLQWNVLLMSTRESHGRLSNPNYTLIAIKDMHNHVNHEINMS